MSTDTATVQALTAEVRVLMVGNRQITLSVARQLDTVKPYDYLIEPFGRVHLYEKNDDAGIVVIGRHIGSGSLVISALTREMRHPKYHEYLGDEDAREEAQEMHNLWMEWRMLPLIVLAGLR